MRTRLTDVLQVEHPVMLAWMGGVSYHRLVAAVSEAGGFGCMGASTMGAQQMRDEIAQVRELTDKPFGVDLLTAAPGDMAAKVNDIIDGGVPEPFPMQVVKSMQEGANHLGGDPSTPDVDPDREFWPAGQGVGSIDELVPAGELVERFVREAEEALGTVRRAFA